MEIYVGVSLHKNVIFHFLSGSCSYCLGSYWFNSKKAVKQEQPGLQVYCQNTMLHSLLLFTSITLQVEQQHAHKEVSWTVYNSVLKIFHFVAFCTSTLWHKNQKVHFPLSNTIVSHLFKLRSNAFINQSMPVLSASCKSHLLFPSQCLMGWVVGVPYLKAP